MNVDLLINTPSPHIGNQIIKLKLIPNFVLADACNLPFPDKCFDEVFSSHLVEHVGNPYGLLKELMSLKQGC